MLTRDLATLGAPGAGHLHPTIHEGGTDVVPHDSGSERTKEVP